MLHSYPRSINHFQWSTFQDFSNNIFSEDFTHDNHLEVRVNSVSTNAGSFKFQELLNFNKDKRLESKEDMRFWFPTNPGFFYTRLTNDEVKLQYDHGVTLIQDQKFNFYGSLTFKRDWKERAIRLGFQSLSNKCRSDNRLIVDQDMNAIWGHKTRLTLGDWRVGIMSLFNISNKTLQKKGFLLGYLKNQWEVYLQAWQDEKHKTENYTDITQWFNNLRLTTVWTRNLQETYGIELEIYPKTRKLKEVWALVQYNQNAKNGLKAKISDRLNLAFVLKRRFSDQFALSLGACLPLAEKDGANKIGVRVDLNV